MRGQAAAGALEARIVRLGGLPQPSKEGAVAGSCRCVSLGRDCRDYSMSGRARTHFLLLAFFLEGESLAPVALLSLSALVAAKLSEARVVPAASLPMAAAQPTIDLDESIAALAARAHVSAPNKKLLQQRGGAALFA